MRIVVCLKQVYDPTTVRVSSRAELDTRDGVLTTNAADLCALETALAVKDMQAAEVIAATLGTARAEDVLLQALALGADRAILLNDPLFAGSDAGVVGYALARAIARLGDVDLVLAGACSWDDNSCLVGPYIAEHLGWSQITCASDVTVAGGRASALRSMEDGNILVSVPLPAVVTVLPTIRPRLATAARIMVCGKRQIERWSAADIGADPSFLGVAGSLTVVRRVFAPEAQTRSSVLDGTAHDAARALAARLRLRGLI